MTQRASLLFVAWGFWLSLAAQPSAALTVGTTNGLDSLLLRDIPEGGPGTAAGILIDGQVVYEKYAGLASIEDSSSITRQSRFNVASNGKQFTALAILLLIENGRLALDDDVRKYLPTLFTEVVDTISIRHLLTHTSGIRDVYDLWSLQGITWWEHTYSNTDVLALLARQQELNFRPGSKYLYSNSNYILLAQIIEEVTGQSFTAYTDAMFERLGMLNTSFTEDYTMIDGPIAEPYFSFETWYNYEWICNIHGDGNLFSTLPDQLRWEAILQQTDTSVLSQTVIEQSQQLLPSASTDRYGYGLEFSTYQGIPYHFHEGSTGAWKATVVRFLDPAISLVTLTNSGRITPDRQTRDMADLLLGKPGSSETYPIAPASSGPRVKVDQVVGTYQNERNFTFRFEVREDGLYLLRSGRNDIRLERESANVFHQANDPPFKQEFTTDSAGQLQVTAYYTSHAPYTLTRANADWTGVDYEGLSGSYVNEETGAQLQLAYDSIKTYLVEIAGNEMQGVLVTPTKLMVDNYAFAIQPTGAGLPPTLLLSAGRIENVRFVRTER